jgi:DNA polymerase-3 subunit beta
MKLTAPVSDLAAALELAASVLNSSPKVEALGAIRLEAAEGWIGIAANALEHMLTTRCAAAVNEDGAIAVRGPALARLVAGFGGDEMVQITSGEKVVSVICGRRRFRLPAIPLEHLPAMLAIDEEAGKAEIKYDDLLRLLKWPLFAVETEKTHFYLNGILLQNTGADLVAVSTDGARLCRVSAPASGVLSNDHTLILPLASTRLLVKLLTRAKGETAIVKRSRTLVEITAADFTFVSKLIDAAYPDYQRIIPKLLESHVTVNRRELAQALERLTAVVDDGIKVAAIVGIMWNGGELRLTLPRQGDAVDDSIDAESNGTCQIAIPLGQLAELVDEFKGQNLRMYVGGAREPMLVIDPHDAGVLVLQMPMAWTFTDAAAAA